MMSRNQIARKRRAAAIVRVESSPGSAVSRGERRKQRTRESLLDAAFRLFAERGIDGVAINEITEAADVGFGSFYNHFPSKEAIHTRLLERLFEEFGEALDRLTSGSDDPAEVVAISVRHTLERAAREPLWARVLVREGTEGRLLARGLGPRLLRDLQRGVERGRFEVPDLLLGFVLVGSGVLGAAVAQLAAREHDVPAPIRQGVRAGALPERTALAVLKTLGVPSREAAALARRPLPRLELPPPKA